MSRSPKTPAAEPTPPTEAPTEGLPVATLNLGEVPAVAALVGLIGAVAALAGFPSRPVPDSLLQNLAKAREAFMDALAEPLAFPAVAAAGASPDDASPAAAALAYDDAWIKAAFESLNEQLKARFEGLEASLQKLADFEASARAPLAERLSALEASVQVSQAPETAVAEPQAAAEA